MQNIRNFSIIAHIDHGKSTLADRLLEATNTVPERLMKDQVLDRMDLERERGITIKLQPVRMAYSEGGEDYVLNLIDTPGHIDFSYEVSRALKAVEGVLLLVDATQGVQAQTLATLAAANAEGCTVIPVLSKIDSPLARADEVSLELAELLNIDPDDIIRTSGKTGSGVPELLSAIVARIPAPVALPDEEAQALIFDFSYSTHRGIVLYVRMFAGSFKKGETARLRYRGMDFPIGEVGFFMPDDTPSATLSAGEIGYLVSGIKEPGVARVGDTLSGKPFARPALPGYAEPRPVVWASVYPESQDDLPLLRQALERLRLTDSALSFEEEASGVLGRGFRCGFLGMLHLEIVTERLRREFSLTLVVTVPTITYKVTTKQGEEVTVYTPSKFPEYGDILKIEEPWVKANLITKPETLPKILELLYEHEAEVLSTENFGDGRIGLSAEMPLRELMRQFFDKLKSASAGYASLSYDLLPMREADVVRLDILVADEPVPAFTRIVSRRRVEQDAEKAVEKLHGVLPRQLFVTKIQGQALGRIISSRSLSALRKDVTGYLYGGDITRKMKLLEKQKKGKKKMLARGKVNIPEDVFMKMLREEG